MLKSMLLAALVFITQNSFATIPDYDYTITTSTEFFLARQVAVVKITNNGRRNQTVFLTPNQNTTVSRLESQRVLVMPGQTTELTVNFAYEERAGQKYYLFHYDVTFADNLRALTKKRTTSIYQLIEKVVVGRGQYDYVAVDEESIMRKTFVAPAIRGVVYPGTATINRGAGVVETVNVPEKTFLLGPDSNLDPRAMPVLEQMRGLKPAEMSEALPMDRIPRVGTVGQTRGEQFNQKSLKSKDTDCSQPFNGCIVGVATYSMTNFFLQNKTYHAAWGFTVEYWELDDTIVNFPQWKLLGSTEVEPSGIWKLKPTFGYRVDRKKMYVYRMGNRFITMKNPTSLDKYYQPLDYTWTEFSFPSKLPNGTWTENRKFFKELPLPYGTGNGLQIIFNQGMKLWSKLFLSQINPVIGFAIKINYPNRMTNMYKKCFNKDAAGNTISWSCSTGALGELFIIPDHAEWETPIHEIGHTINKKFWGKHWPSPGGNHSAGGCYSPGLALAEGFASFLALWVRYEPSEKTPNSIFGNMETWNVPCADGVQNEFAVTATLWDLYDTQNETVSALKYDRVNYVEQGGVLYDYLGTKLNNINDMRYKVMGNQTMEVQKWIYDMFALNGTLVP